MWNLLPLQIRDHLKRLTPGLPHEGNMVDKGTSQRAAADTSMTTD
jgi:hypothetical protein